MTITLSAELEQAISEAARVQGLDPQTLAIDVLRGRFLVKPRDLEPRDDWERALLKIDTDCGVSPPSDAWSSESYYD